MSAMSGAARGGVLALVPEGRRGNRTLAAAAKIADERDSWLTIAVPLCSAWSELGRLESIDQWPEVLEQYARRELERHIDVLDRPRVCGLVVQMPLFHSLLRRIESAQHDVVVVPRGVGHFALRSILAARGGARVVAS